MLDSLGCMYAPYVRLQVTLKYIFNQFRQKCVVVSRVVSGQINR